MYGSIILWTGKDQHPAVQLNEVLMLGELAVCCVGLKYNNIFSYVWTWIWI